MSSLTSDLGNFVATFGKTPAYGIEPDSAALATACHTALMGITDAVGVMLAALQEPVVRTLAGAILATDAGGPSKVLLCGTGAAPMNAALINATAAHALAMDDVAAGCHPSAVLMPALLAEAQAIPASGSDVLRAYVAGYEVLCELSRRIPEGLHVTGWHPTGQLGPIAVAAALANLKGLSVEQSRHALALAASMTGGLMGNFGTPTKALHAGRASQAGVFAVQMAQAGITGAADILEKPAGLLLTLSPSGKADVDSPFRRSSSTLCILNEGLSIKQYPLCYSTHRVVDAAASITRKPGFSPARIRQITVRIGAKQAAMAGHHRPRTPTEAKYSVEFAAVCGLLEGASGFEQLQPAFITSDSVVRLIERTTLELDSRPSDTDPIFCPTDRVMVVMDDSTVYDSGDVAHANGHSRLPLSADDLQRKFLDCASRGGYSEGAALFARLRALPDATSLCDLVAANAPAFT